MGCAAAWDGVGQGDRLPPARVQVAETRQLKEEEELKMAETAEDMAKLYFTIEELRAAQGYRYGAATTRQASSPAPKEPAPRASDTAERIRSPAFPDPSNHPCTAAFPVPLVQQEAGECGSLSPSHESVRLGVRVEPPVPVPAAG